MSLDNSEKKTKKSSKNTYYKILNKSIDSDFKNCETNNLNNVFEMEDFTNLTEFEKISFTLEVILRKWNIQLEKNTNIDMTNIKETKWIEKSQKFLFKGKNLLIKYYYPEINNNYECLKKFEPSNCSNIPMNKFYSNVPSLVNEYGILKWVLICPESENDVISNKDDLNFLTSCLKCCDITCTVPFIIQFENNSKHLFCGFQQNKFSMYQYKSCYLKTFSPNFDLFIDIKNIFLSSSKYNTVKTCDILHACEYEYSYCKMKNKNNKLTLLKIFHKNNFINQLFEILKYNKYFERITNFIKELNLIIQFDGTYNDKLEDFLYSEENILSSDNYNSKWLCHIKFKNEYNQFLTNALKQYMILLKDTTLYITSIKNILANIDERFIKKNVSNSLFFSNNIELNFNESINLSFKTVTIEEIKNFQLISKEVVKNIFTIVKNSSSKYNDNECYDEEYLSIKTILQKSKSSPSNSVVELISLTISFILYKEKHGIIFSSILWNEFLNTLQYYFENNKNIPGVSKKSHPHFNHSTLQQNIEFLQCCINSKKKWSILNDYQKEYGRDMKSNLSLYCNSNEYIYIPILQNKIPQTEEMFQDEIENLVQTNSDERQINQLKFLISDMCAFKAANPKCSFEDFIRWHSPNDWIFNDKIKKYQLSTRMSGQNNIWKKKWDQSIPLSVYKQKKNFNENEEWKKTIDKFKNVTFGQMMSLLLPSIFKGTIQLLLENYKIFLPKIKQKFKKLSIKFSQYTFQTNIDMYQNIFNEISYIENYIEKHFYLKQCFAKYFVNGNDISYIDYLIMEMANNNTIEIENNKRKQFEYLIETTCFDEHDNFIFSKQIPSSKRHIFSFSDSRVYILYSKDGKRIYSKIPISYINFKYIKDEIKYDQHP